MTVPPIEADELPPPYTETPGVTPTINCKVCQQIVSIEGKQNQHVIKCTFCNEATPIKAAPPGKKYVRCPCNCLLICKVTSRKIACPRENCKRIITLGGPVAQAVTRSPDTSRIQCPYCGQVFLFSISIASLSRCPHCRKVSTTSPVFVRTRMIIYLMLGIALLGAGIGVTVTTYELARSRGGIYTVWIGAFIMGIIFLLRGIYFATIRANTLAGAP